MRRLTQGTIVSLLALSLAACSGKTSNRFDLWGTVTFNGRPVPAGLIVINPDLSKGNDGPQGLAEIRDGRFDTRPLAKGAPSGPVILMIDGFDGPMQGESPTAKPLFTGYKLSMDLPREPTERHIEIPASAGATAKAPTGPLP
jgi:hypothetical protein